MAITKAEVSETFNGQSDIVVFDAPTGGYTKTTTFAQVTASGTSVGQVVEDSTEWTGEDASIENILDEQGRVIVGQAKDGTFGLACDLANMSKENVVKFLNGAGVTVSGSPVNLKNVTDVVKAGVEMPVMTRPLAILNDEANRFILFPKAKIIASVKLDSKLFRIHIQATAEYINTSELGTLMMGKGEADYGTGD